MAVLIMLCNTAILNFWKECVTMIKIKNSMKSFCYSLTKYSYISGENTEPISEIQAYLNQLRL
jgi:hypothetical protein